MARNVHMRLSFIARIPSFVISACSLNLKIYRFEYCRVPDRHCLTDRVHITGAVSNIWHLVLAPNSEFI